MLNVFVAYTYVSSLALASVTALNVCFFFLYPLASCNKMKVIHVISHNVLLGCIHNRFPYSGIKRNVAWPNIAHCLSCRICFIPVAMHSQFTSLFVFGLPLIIIFVRLNVYFGWWELRISMTHDNWQQNIIHIFTNARIIANWNRNAERIDSFSY